MTTGERPATRIWADVRIPYSPLIAGAMCAVAFLAVLYLARRLDFFYDEWDFVLGARHWGVADFFQPHNEHWSTIPQVIYALLLAVNGMRSYLPFMAVLLALHCASAMLLFGVIRRRSGDVLGLVAAAMLLFLGRGWEDILWAFQIGFVGSVAAGLLAMYVLDDDAPASPARLAIASVALLLGVMSSGVGILFCAAVAADLVLDARRRRGLVALALPAVAYAVWYLAIGRGAVHAPLTPSVLPQLLAFVLSGVGAAAAGLFSLSPAWSQLGLAMLAAAGGVALARSRVEGVDSRVVGAAVGLVAQYVLTGLVRSAFGAGEAASPRYVYIGSVFILLALTGILRTLPWRGLWPALIALAAIGVGFNAVHLRQAAASQDENFVQQRAELATVWLYRDAPGVDRGATVDARLMPQVQVGAYIAARSVYGSPIAPVTEAGLAVLPPPAVNLALRNLFPLSTTAVPAATATPPGPCTTPAGATDVSPAEGGGVLVRVQQPGQVGLQLWAIGPDPDVPPLMVPAGAGQDVLVGVPDTGSPLMWRLRVIAPPGTAVSVCGAS